MSPLFGSLSATRAVSVALACAPLLSCTSDVPYRTARLEFAPQCRPVYRENDSITEGNGSIAEKLTGSDCWSRSFEEHPEYDLLTIEFDDQGWLQGTSGFIRRRPDHLDDMRAALAQIYNENRENGISIVLFVHGWHHNASPRDKDVENFRRFLGTIKAAENGRTLSPRDADAKRRAYNEQAGAGPRVVGIFVGWRGESINMRGLRYATFWDRKSTAEQVAAGSVRELFQLLDVVHDCGRTGLDWETMMQPLSREREQERGEPAGRRNVQMLTIGHSFGGLITYRAMSSEFVGHAVTASKNAFVARTGGLVIIVNPAFEGARYEPLHIAGQRIPDYLRPNQLPAVIVATSRADLATRYAFPIARWFYTIFESMPEAERDASILAVGHNERYRTHELTTCASNTDPNCRETCQPKTAEKLEIARKATVPDRLAVLGETELMDSLRQTGLPEKTLYLCNGLKLDTTTEPIPPRNPFWVVSTSEAIMDGHNDIFNEKFVAFFRQMYLGIALARTERRAAPRCVR